MWLVSGKGVIQIKLSTFSLQSSGDASLCAFHNSQKTSQKNSYYSRSGQLSRMGPGHEDDRLWSG